LGITIAFSAPLNAAIRSRYISSTSLADTWPSRRAASRSTAVENGLIVTDAKRIDLGGAD
jgi:hypothetical protein